MWTAGPEVFGSVLTARAAAGPSCMLWTTDPAAVTAEGLRIQKNTPIIHTDGYGKDSADVWR